MSFNAPNHFSYHFELNLKKIPAKCSDRIALSLLIPGIVFSVFLIMIGIYEASSGLSPYNDASISEFISPWFSLALFDIILVALGIWTLGVLLFTYFTYKKVFFDGKKITLIYRHAFGAKTTIKESIKKYKGVRFRVEFFQFGFLNKSKYIIELFHDDVDKIAPLYISTSGHNIREIWKFYAQKFNLPEIIMTENGWVSRSLEDIDKSVSEQYKDGVIQDKYRKNGIVPHGIYLVNKKDKNVIKIRKIHWDIFNIISLFFIGVGLFALLLSLPYVTNHPLLIIGCFVAALFLILSLCRLFTKDKLVIKPQKIILVHKTFFFSRKKSELYKTDIKVVDVALNPSNDRYFLLIIGNDNTLVFGKKLSLENLVWVKQFLIHHIIKK